MTWNLCILEDMLDKVMHHQQGTAHISRYLCALSGVICFVQQKDASAKACALQESDVGE